MHATADPVYVELPVGQAARIAITITNTSNVIDAFDVSAFGLDPQWVQVEPGRLSLFPGETGIVETTIALPDDFPAGERAIAVHVRSENDPAEFSLAQVNLDIAERPRTTLRVDPSMIIGGSKATFGLVIGNEGNATIEVRPHGVDPEDRATIMFEPASVVLPPGRREVVRARVKGGRPWFGQPKPRILAFGFEQRPAETMATFLQRPRIGRWLISMIGLITVAAVFAAVLSRTFDKVVDEADVDPALLNAALDDSQPVGAVVPVDPAKLTGKVVSATSATGIAGVQADLFSADNGVVALASAATNGDGEFVFGKLGAGTFRIRFTGAGFAEQWYLGADTFGDATDIEVEAGADVPLDDLELGGRPGTVAGSVIAEDPTGAVATLIVPGTADPDVDAEVLRVDVSADGSFLFEGVPSPAQYQLVVEKPGFATEVRDVVLGAAQEVEGIEVTLREGDGVIGGHILSPAGTLGGVSIEATDGTTTVSTVSLTVGDVGFFALRSLPTPGTYTITVEREGYTSQTVTVSLTPAQQTLDLAITIAPNTGGISGTAGLTGIGPAGGVTVTITGGEVELTTVSASVGVPGEWVVENLPVPATYTITFSRTGYVSQTRLVDLDPLAGTGVATLVDATLLPADAVIRGFVRGVDGTPVSTAVVSLTDGTDTWRVPSASEPLGSFEFGGIPAGTYTLTAELPGTTPAVVLVNVTPAEIEEVDLRLLQRASVFGQVLVLDPQTGSFVPFRNATVRLFVATNFPGPPANAARTVSTDVDGRYSLADLEAPENYVVAVYASTTAGDPIDSALVQTVPSQAVQVPTFQVREVF